MIEAPQLSARTIDAIIASGLNASDLGDERGSDPQYRMQPESTVELLARTLAALHMVALPEQGGSDVAVSPDDVVVGAEQLVARAGIESGDLDPSYRHISPERLVAILRDGLGRVGPIDRVVTIGGATLENLRCHRGRAIGFYDWSDAAVADPYRDLAVAATSIATDIGPGAVPLLFDTYSTDLDRRSAPDDSGSATGIGLRRANVDALRLDWWALAAQLRRR